MALTDAAAYGFSPYAVPTLLTAVLMLGFGVSVLARRVSAVSLTLFSLTFAAAVWLLAFTFSAMAASSDLLVDRVQHYWWGYYPRYTAILSVPFLTFFFGYLVA